MEIRTVHKFRFLRSEIGKAVIGHVKGKFHDTAFFIDSSSLSKHGA